MIQAGRAVAFLVGVVGSFSVLTGCASKRQIAQSALTLAPDLVAALYDEPDLETARASAFGTINLLEALHRADPANPTAPLLLAEACGGIAFNFLLDDAERLAATDPAGAETARARARDFFRRGRAHAAELLARQRPALAQAFAHEDVLTLKRALDAEHSRELVPVMFWYAFNWMGEIDAAGSSVVRPTELPRLRLLVHRVAELDERFHFGAPRLMQATLWCALPEAYGGDLDEGKRAFEQAIALSEGHLLLARVEYVRLYAVARRDRQLFDAQLQAVIDAPSDTLLGFRFLTEAAKRRGRRLLAAADALFGVVTHENARLQ